MDAEAFALARRHALARVLHARRHEEGPRGERRVLEHGEGVRAGGERGLDGRDVVGRGRGREFLRAAGVARGLAGLEERGLGRAVGRRDGERREDEFAPHLYFFNCKLACTRDGLPVSDVSGNVRVIARPLATLRLKLTRVSYWWSWIMFLAFSCLVRH